MESEKTITCITFSSRCSRSLLILAPTAPLRRVWAQWHDGRSTTMKRGLPGLPSDPSGSLKIATWSQNETGRVTSSFPRRGVRWFPCKCRLVPESQWGLVNADKLTEGSTRIIRMNTSEIPSMQSKQSGKQHRKWNLWIRRISCSEMPHAVAIRLQHLRRAVDPHWAISAGPGASASDKLTPSDFPQIARQSTISLHFDLNGRGHLSRPRTRNGRDSLLLGNKWPETPHVPRITRQLNANLIKCNGSFCPGAYENESSMTAHKRIQLVRAICWLFQSTHFTWYDEHFRIRLMSTDRVQTTLVHKNPCNLY